MVSSISRSGSSMAMRCLFEGCKKDAGSFDELIEWKDGELTGSSRKLLDMWPKTVELYAADEYVVKIRDKEIRTVLTSESLSGSKIRKVALPRFEDDMRDLSVFADGSFDLIVHPCSNMFVPEVQPVWQECQRVLRPGGRLMAGFCNPIRYLFDFDLLEQDKFEVKYSLPYSDLTHLSEVERQRLVDDKQPLEFGHTLDSLIGGQLAAGFVITGFYEDRWQGQALDQRIATFIVTCAQKMF